MDFINRQAKIAYQQLKQLARNTAIGAVIILGIAAMLAPKPSLLLTVLPNIAYAFFASLVIGVAAGITKTFLSRVGSKLGHTIGKDIGKKLVNLVRNIFYAKDTDIIVTVPTTTSTPITTVAITNTKTDEPNLPNHNQNRRNIKIGLKP